MREGWHEYFKIIARAVSTRSTCPRRQVGAVLVIDKRIYATGYNGSRAGEAHCTDVGCDVKSNHCTRAIHAERNVVDQFVKAFGWDYFDAAVDIYCTLEPCFGCKRYIYTHFHDATLHWIQDYKDYENEKIQAES